MSAQNMFDATIAGYENHFEGNNDFKKAYSSDLWYGNYTDSAFYVTAEKSYSGTYSLCFRDTLDVLRKVNGTVDIKKSVYFSNLPVEGETLATGKYVHSEMVYLEESNTMTELISEIGSTPAASITWDITNTPRGEWVKLVGLFDILTDLDVTSDNGANARLVNKVPSDASNHDFQKMYIDDHQLFPYVATEIEGNHLESYYFGFEAGTDEVSNVFIPNVSQPYVSFSYDKNTDYTSNLFALKFDIPASTSTSTGYSIQLGNLDTNGGNAKLDKDKSYDASLSVYKEDDNVKQFTTAFAVNGTTPSIFKSLTWDVSEVKVGEWVTLHQVVTFAEDINTKVTIKLNNGGIIDEAKAAVLYIDDIAFVDYVLPTFEEIYSFDAGFLGGDGVWFTAPAGDFVTVSDEKAFSGAYALKYSCDDVSTLPAEKIQMGLGKSEVENSYVSLEAGTYNVKCKVWVSTDCSVKTIGLNIKEPGTPSNFDLSTVAKGEWVELSNTVTLATAADESTFQIILKAANYGVGTFYLDDITFEKTTPTAIDDNTFNDISIFPNPASGIVNVKAQEGSDIKVYSLSGQMVKSINNVASLSTFSTSDFAKGMYLVTVENADQKTVVKLQVK